MTNFVIKASEKRADKNSSFAIDGSAGRLEVLSNKTRPSQTCKTLPASVLDEMKTEIE